MLVSHDPQRTRGAIHRSDRSHKFGDEFSGSPERGMAGISWAIFVSYVAFERSAPTPATALPKSANEAEISMYLRSEHVQESVSRRGVVRAFAAGAAASTATATPGEQQTAVLAEATAADYARDPTRWGSAEIAALFPGFCRDYRAAATCDLEMDMADKDRQIGMPFLLLFGTRGRRRARNIPRSGENSPATSWTRNRSLPAITCKRRRPTKSTTISSNSSPRDASNRARSELSD
jgi:hypothetical protein